MWKVLLAPVVSVLLASGAVTRDGEQELLDRIAPSIVTVEIVLDLEIHMGGQVQKDETTIVVRGSIVDSSGLVMVSSSALDPGASIPQMEIRSTPREVKITLENEDAELRARVVAEDSIYSLTYLAIEEVGERELIAIDWNNLAEKPEAGTEFFGVDRLPRGYDFAPNLVRGRVTGRIKKPRRASMFDVGPPPGLPVFDRNGQMMGVVTFIEPSIGSPSLFGSQGPGVFLVGARAIQTSVEQAQEQRRKGEAQVEGAVDGDDGEKDGVPSRGRSRNQNV